MVDAILWERGVLDDLLDQLKRLRLAGKLPLDNLRL